MLPIRQNEDGIVFTIMVLPRSSKCEIVGIQDDALKLKIAAPPVEGRANEECIRFLAERLGIKKARITMIGGHKGRRKTISIAGLNSHDLLAIIPAS